MHRASLTRKSASAPAPQPQKRSSSAVARDTGLLVHPRYAKNTTDVIVGYSVTERPKQGARPIWFGGGTLTSHLKLGALREECTDSPHLAIEAAAEWNASARNKRKVSRTGPANATPSANVWVEYTGKATALVEKLRVLPRE
ncbi:hypothetical protein [Arthrobacter sp. NPDC057013]|uniref:hypothetical protein n=1 Tax=Arthrobacter sp. NPDC057013 TaxID=3345999 RepID=UPI003635BA7B